MEEVDLPIITDATNKARSMLFFLDLDGTLSPINTALDPIAPAHNIKEALIQLSEDSGTQVLIISGRSREDLDRVMGELPLLLVAEHGGFFREPFGKWIARFPASVSWKSRVLPSIHGLAHIYKGSIVEEKYYSICWHYRFTKDGIGDFEIQKIVSTLHLISNKNEFVIQSDNLTIEIRSVGVDKGKFAAQWIRGQGPFDFILAMGDSKSDEDLFEAVGSNYFTIRVGNAPYSAARYYINDQKEVEPFLLALVKT